MGPAMSDEQIAENVRAIDRSAPDPSTPNQDPGSGHEPGSLSADPVRLRCSHHDIELVCIDRQPPRLWTCPIAALHDLCDRFEQVYEANYGPAPAGENGVYHHARRVVEAAHSAQGES